MDKKTIKRQLCITPEVKQQLVKIFNCTPRMVEKAMWLHEISDLARRIQKMARMKGAYTQVIAPECETIHIDDKRMVQFFENGAFLEIEKSTGECKVTHNGKEVRTITLAAIPELEQLQEEIAQWK